MNKQKALIAMSGGVDSSVAAYLMKQAGYDCIGVTMKLFDPVDAGVEREKSCCSLSDVEDARSVAYRLGIPYYVFNFTADFHRQVLERFVCAYENGATPNPCIDCNRYLKFDSLYQRAQILGCDRVATGHYARIVQIGNRYVLKKALDASKDQSYVLYALTSSQLAHTAFPLGTLCKRETRQIAKEQGFYNADKPDSQDICFVPDGDYTAFIRRFTGKDYPAGDFTDAKGNVLGTHRGIICYTVGQRRGLGIAAPQPLYVTRICPAENRVVLGSKEELFCADFVVKDCNFTGFATVPTHFSASVQVRYRGAEQEAQVTVLRDTTVRVHLCTPQSAVTVGQAAVFYDGDLLLGGGTIAAVGEEAI